MNRLSYLIFRIFLVILKVIPFFLLYAFAKLLYILMFYIVKYRRKVVYNNLSGSFPEKDETEINQISKRFYKHLSEIFVESVKGFSMSEKSFEKRYKITGHEVAQKYLDQGRTVIALAGHYGNWEWGIETAARVFSHKVIALYQPLTNPIIDKYLTAKRRKGGMYLVPVFETRNSFEEGVETPSLIIMAADQSPPTLKKSIWVKFLNRETACMYGPEHYSQKYNTPIVYFDVQRVKRGYYTLEIKEFLENPGKTKPGTVTKLYMNTLEKIILNKPENWLWSHKRWKHKIPNENEQL